MNAWKTARMALAVAVAMCCLWWAKPDYTQAAPQDAPGAASTSATNSTSSEKGATKEKHWSGDLVDVGCMVSSLRPGGTTAAPSSGPGAGMPHFAGSADPAPQSGQTSGGSSGAGTMRNAGGPPTGSANSPNTYPQDEARMEQQERMDSAIKKCTPTPSTQSFGLAMNNGQLFQFDEEGNLKAIEALRENPAEPGKKVKAKVGGTMQDNTTVKVASVDIRSKNNKHS